MPAIFELESEWPLARIWQLEIKLQGESKPYNETASYLEVNGEIALPNPEVGVTGETNKPPQAEAGK